MERHDPEPGHEQEADTAGPERPADKPPEAGEEIAEAVGGQPLDPVEILVLAERLAEEPDLRRVLW
ncbi:MAG TPA: hypothetical protein P5144_12035 [Thermoanaerobaculia bacterium]|nr:hypothetical protein [Thermoanaerobaculia bacterium]HRU10095.1 hypothetical protein [Thermoanaerobaculia bacterium]